MLLRVCGRLLAISLLVPLHYRHDQRLIAEMILRTLMFPAWTVVGRGTQASCLVLVKHTHMPVLVVVPRRHQSPAIWVIVRLDNEILPWRALRGRHRPP